MMYQCNRRIGFTWKRRWWQKLFRLPDTRRTSLWKYTAQVWDDRIMFMGVKQVGNWFELSLQIRPTWCAVALIQDTRRPFCTPKLWVQLIYSEIPNLRFLPARIRRKILSRKEWKRAIRWNGKLYSPEYSL